MKLIGISGKTGVGKTTVADLICKRRKHAYRTSFADALKREVSSVYCFPVEWCYSPEGKKNFVYLSRANSGSLPWPKYENGLATRVTVREILQWYGTDYRRAQDPDYWVKEIRKRLEWERAYPEDLRATSGICPERIIVIDDVRFASEANLIREYGGTLVRIEVYPGYTVDETAGSHVSETELDDYTGFDVTFWPLFGKGELKFVAEALLNR